MILHFLLLIAGLLLLIKGADWLVENSSAFARKKNVSDLAIGLTIVAFGTSAPELVVNVVAAYQGHDDIVFGNVIGSNNFNLLFYTWGSRTHFPIAGTTDHSLERDPNFAFGCSRPLFPGQ
jgi:cation:H+ antiporter